MHYYEEPLKVIQKHVDDIFARPGESMDTYQSLVELCNQLEEQIGTSYAWDKLSNIRIEAEMVASGRYESGMTVSQIRQNLRADIHTLDSEIKENNRKGS